LKAEIHRDRGTDSETETERTMKDTKQQNKEDLEVNELYTEAETND
jgi:hypothetical protein